MGITAVQVLNLLRKHQTKLFDDKFATLPNYQYMLYFPITPMEDRRYFPQDLLHWKDFLRKFETKNYHLSFDYDPGYPELLVINRTKLEEYESTPKPFDLDQLLFMTHMDSNFAAYYPHTQLTELEYYDLMYAVNGMQPEHYDTIF